MMKGGILESWFQIRHYEVTAICYIPQTGQMVGVWCCPPQAPLGFWGAGFALAQTYMCTTCKRGGSLERSEWQLIIFMTRMATTDIEDLEILNKDLNLCLNLCKTNFVEYSPTPARISLRSACRASTFSSRAEIVVEEFFSSLRLFSNKRIIDKSLQ